jgi:hypothetical protein
MLPIPRRAAKIFVAAAVPAGLLISGTTMAAAAQNHPANGAGRHHASPLAVRQILSGKTLSHSFVPAGFTQSRSEPLTQPDDIAVLGRELFVGFQNGVGAQGEPSTDGNRDSTIVEFTTSGHIIRQWDITGKNDGLAADPQRHLIIATVNEDLKSSVYTITPRAESAGQVRHFSYNEPLPHNGGTDAISVDHGRVLISASAPGTTGAAAPQPAYPAVYSVTFNRRALVATVIPLFADEATATVASTDSADHGRQVKLALSDPDSNSVVPRSAPRFAGDFMLNSQGDGDQIFASQHGRRLSLLRLSQSVDDTAWATDQDGRLFVTDSHSNAVDVVTGSFADRPVMVAVTPCDANNAPATCAANFLGVLNLRTGQVSPVPVTGASLQPKGMIFVSG